MRTYDIKPIPTTYDGVKFRSRLEARWAVFFNQLRIQWFYEYEGYQFETQWYLPDFWLPEISMYMEVKPDVATEREQALCAALAVTTGKGVYLHPGAMINPYKIYHWDDNHIYWNENGMGDFPYFWCMCDKCGKLGVEFEGRAHRLCNCYDDDKGWGHGNETLNYAFECAAKYQFDY